MFTRRLADHSWAEMRGVALSCVGAGAARSPFRRASHREHRDARARRYTRLTLPNGEGLDALRNDTRRIASTGSDFRACLRTEGKVTGAVSLSLA
jgi:hypothetical protein